MKRKKIALVTGGTRGIGKSIVRQLLLDGFYVIVNYKNLDTYTKKSISDIKKISNDVFFVEGDISAAVSIDSLLDKVSKKINRIDVLINNAGVINAGREETLEKVSMSEVRRIFETNFFGTVYLTKKFLPLIKKSVPGKIIFINSAISFVGSEGQFSYLTSKTANMGTVRALALELAPWNVCVNAVVPGSIQTRMMPSDKQLLNTKLNKIPLKRIGRPEEVAYLVSFLASEKANYITGQHIHINGGRILL